MCDFDKGFVLCTCEDKEKLIINNKNSRRYKKGQTSIPPIYHWYLSTFEKIKNDEYPPMEGQYEIPASNIGQGLTEEWVLLNLNDRNCFDFDYIPKEGDNLIIRDLKKQWIYLSFIFRNGYWERGHYDIFNTVKTLKIYGEVKQIESDE